MKDLTFLGCLTLFVVAMPKAGASEVSEMGTTLYLFSLDKKYRGRMFKIV